MKHNFELFADYFQFYLQDEQSKADYSANWTEQSHYDKLVVAPGVVAVVTARNMDVPVEVEVLDSEPSDNFDHWDYVTEASLEVPSGRIIIAGCTDYPSDAARLIIQPGTYRLRIYYDALDSVDELGLEGNDHYRVVLWLNADIAESKVLKRWESTRNSSTNQELEEPLATKLLNQAMDKSRQRLFQETIEYCTKTIQLNSNLDKAYFLRGCAKYNLGDKQGGIEDIEKVIEIFSNQGDLNSASFYHEWLNRQLKVSI